MIFDSIRLRLIAHRLSLGHSLIIHLSKNKTMFICIVSLFSERKLYFNIIEFINHPFVKKQNHVNSSHLLRLIIISTLLLGSFV